MTDALLVEAGVGRDIDCELLSNDWGRIIELDGIL